LVQSAILVRDAADVLDKIGRDIAAGAVAAQRDRADTVKRAAISPTGCAMISISASLERITISQKRPFDRGRTRRLARARTRMKKIK